MIATATTTARSGSLSAVLLVAWSEVMIRSPSTSMPGIARGTEPVHRMVALPLRVWTVHRHRPVGQ